MMRSPLGDGPTHPRLGAVGRTDGIEGVERPARRTTVQRARERAQRGDDRRAHVGTGRRDHARGERRRVEAVVDSPGSGTARAPGRGRIGLVTVDHVEVVGGGGQVGTWRDRLEAACDAGGARRRVPASPRPESEGVGADARPARRRTSAASAPTAARCDSAVRSAPSGAVDAPAIAGRSASTSAGRSRRVARDATKRSRSSPDGSSPSNSRYQTSSNVPGRGQLGGRVLAVVVEAFESLVRRRARCRRRSRPSDRGGLRRRSWSSVPSPSVVPSSFRLRPTCCQR